MKRSLLIAVAMLLTVVTFGQLSGTKTIPGDYSSIVLAVADLNTQGVGAGGVTFNISAGYAETITAPISVTATGTASNPVVFQKSGTGANPVITAYTGTATPTSAVQDGIWNLVGSDYITIDNIDLYDPNSTNPATMEYGFAMFKKSATDGCQYNTIKNCVITLSRVNNASSTSPAIEGSRGIFIVNSLVTTQTTSVTPTSAAGTNSYNMIFTNLVQNCNYGIALSGYAAATPFTLGDTGNNIGGNSTSTGNTVLNYGGASAASNPSAGIRANNQWGINISYNTINNNNGSGVNHANTLRGIYAQAGTSASATIKFNNITLNGGGTTSALSGIENAIGSTAASNTVDILNNTVTGSYSTATTGVFYGIYNTATAANVNITENTISNISTPGTGSLYGISAGSPTNLMVNQNLVQNLTKTGIGGVYGIQMSTATVICRSNTIDGLYCTAASSTASVYGIYDGASPVLETYSYNTVKNLSSTGTATIYGLYLNTATGNKTINGNEFFNFTIAGGGTIYGINLNYGSTDAINDNLVHDFNITGTASGTLYGIRIAAGTTNNLFNNSIYNFNTAGGTGGSTYGCYLSTGTTNNFYRNKVYNLASSSTGPTLYGVYLVSGTTNSLYNNYISDLRTPLANAGIPLAGIYAGGGTNANVFYNTVYLAGSSSGALFGSAALYASTSVALDMRNNILVNQCTPSGTGITAAFRRSSTTLTTYSSNSNANCYFATATEDATHTVFYDGTNSYTMSAFQTLVGPARDAVSFRHLPPFTNVATTPYNLHILTTAATSCESGGLQVVTPFAVNDDFDLDIRQGSTGYTGTGTAPDVGADEFNGIANYTCTAPNPGNTVASSTTVCLGQSVILSMQNATSGTGNTFQWQSSENGTDFTNITGGNLTTYTVIPVTALWYRCMVTCINGPVSVASNPVHVTFTNQVLTTTPGSRCGTGTVILEATGTSGTTLKWYTANIGGTNVGSGSPFTTPSISTTTNYYVGSETVTSGSVTLGSGASTSTGSESPWYYLWGGHKNQFLIKASELTALGLSAGNITAVSFDVAASTSTTFQGFNMSLGHTSLTALTSTFQSGLTSVYSTTAPAGITPTTGIFTITFTTPFNWDGVSNLIVETCWSNNNTGSSSNSATVKYDVTSFVSNTYRRVDSQTPSTFCGGGSSGTLSSRPKMVFAGSTSCSSPRVEVVATVVAAPVFSITGNQTVCNNNVAAIQVTSPLSNYDVYSWSPVTNLFTDAACTTPYTAGASASTVYVKSAGAAVTAYTCTASNAALCVSQAQSTVTTLPPSVIIAATPGILCISGTSALSATPSTGYGAATLQWQFSPDNTTFSDITGATAATYTTATLTTTSYFRLVVSLSGTPCLTSDVLTLSVSSPAVTSLTPGSRCGTGTVNLGATASGGTINWWSASSGGTMLGTGESFTTPVISATTSYWVNAVASGSQNYTVGKPSTNGADGTNTSGGLVFTASVPFTLNSVYVYPVGTGAGTITIQLQNSSSTVLQTATVNVTGTTTPGIKTLIPLNFSVPSGTGLKLAFTSYSGAVSGLIRDYTTSVVPAIAFPYTVPGVVSITDGTLAGYYYFFYDWSITSGCTTARQEVIATVTPPPSLTITPDQTVCNNSVATISVLSALASFDSYIWTPVSNLFTDFACTVPYTAGTNATTVYAQTTSAGSVTYTCTASNSSGCVNTAQTVVTNIPGTVMASAAPDMICNSGTTTLGVTPTTGYGTATFQWQSSQDNAVFADISGATALSYTTSVLTNTTWYRMNILLNGSVCYSSSVATVTVNAPAITGTTPGSHCGTGTVVLEATGTGGTLNWYAAATGGIALGTGSTFTTPVLNTTTTYYVGSETPSSGQVTFGTGTSLTSNTGYPTAFGNRWYQDWSQMVYTAAELTAAGLKAGPITAVTFKIGAIGSSANVSNYKISLGTVTASTLSSFTTSGLTTVYGPSTYTSAVGFNTITFTTPYIWDGTSNILLDIRGTGTNATYNATTYYTATTGSNTVVYAYSSSNNTGFYVSSTSATTSTSRLNVIFAGITACSSPRVAVTATITNPPALTITGNHTVCNDQPAMVTVTSNTSDYDSFTWSPAVNLFTDAACTVPYTAGSSALTVYFKTAVAGNQTLTCSAANSSTLCSNTATTVITVSPANPVIHSSPSVICNSGNAILTITPATGYGSDKFQWQESIDNATFTNIPGATNTTYVTNVLTTTRFYRLLVGDSNFVLCSQSLYTMQVSNPLITGTTPGSRCGTGSVSLAATGSGGTITWYPGATSTTVSGTGPSFSTPVISTTTSYWVAEVASGSGTGIVGNGATTSATYPNPFYSLWSNTHNQYLVLASELMVAGVPAGNISSLGINITSGTMSMSDFSIKMANTNATSMSAFVSPAFTTVYTATTQTPVVGLNTIVFTNAFTWDGISNVVIEVCHGNSASSATMSSTCTADNTSYVSTIHVQVSGATAGSTICGNTTTNLATYSVRPKFTFGYTGCESPRVEVVATVTAAPAITPSATPASVCAGSPATLNVTSPDSNYTYVWTPGSLNGAQQTVYPTDNTTYTVTANDAGSGCSNSATVTVGILATPSDITITPTAPVIYPGDVQPLTASGGSVSGNANIGTATTTNTTTSYPSPYTNYYGGTKHQMLILASELTSAGFVAGTAINSITFKVTEVGSTFTGSLSNFRIDMAHTTQTVLTSTTFVGGLTNVLPAATVNIQVGKKKHNLATPFVWDGTSNVVVQTSYSNANSGTSTDYVLMTNSDPGFISTNWYRADGSTAAVIFGATTPTAAGNARPNMILGYSYQTPVTWAPVTDLYTDLGATTPYTGSAAMTVYAKPSVTSTYTATATNAVSGCTKSRNVTVTVMAPCGIPVDVTTSSVTSNSAVLSWTAPATPPGSGYEFEIRTSGTPGSGTTGLVQSGTTATGVTSANISGLNPNSQYHAYLRSNCGDNVYSLWTADHPFTTLIEPLSMYAELTPVTCYGYSNGTLSSYVWGGVPPYSYQWSNGVTTSNNLGLAAGDYSLTVSDAASNSTSGTWAVTQPEQLLPIVVITPGTCFGSGDGTMTVTSVGGTAPYSFFWSGPSGWNSTSQNNSNLAAGSYNLTITDMNGCQYTNNYQVTEPEQVTASGTVTNAGCPGQSNGSITVTVAGGTTPYSYLWSTGATTANLSNVAAGTYSLTVTDNHNCTGNGSWVVGLTNPVCSAITVAGVVNTLPAVCYNATGTITVAGSGTVFEVSGAGRATFIAGSKISYLPGTKVYGGGYMRGYIAPGGPWCTTSKLTEVSPVPEEQPEVTGRLHFSLYPNPTNGNFTIIQKGENQYHIVKIEIFGMSGEKVITENMVGQKHEFNFSLMPAGMYFVKMIADGYVETIKLVKTR